MSEPYLGDIVMFGFNFAPRGWALCDGQILPIAQNQALFSLLGTTYGGDGRTTFALPDMRGRAPLKFGNGAGLSNRPLGQKGGQNEVSLTVQEIPAHTHPLFGSPDNATSLTPNAAGNKLVSRPQPAANSFGESPSADGRADQVSGGGIGQGHPNMQPYLAVSFCIAVSGVFPSRN